MQITDTHISNSNMMGNISMNVRIIVDNNVAILVFEEFEECYERNIITSIQECCETLLAVFVQKFIEKI